MSGINCHRCNNQGICKSKLTYYDFNKRTFHCDAIYIYSISISCMYAIFLISIISLKKLYLLFFSKYCRYHLIVLLHRIP
jgi:hypothetical protein